MRPKLVAGNWKSNGDFASNQLLVESLLSHGLGQQDLVDVVIFPPNVFLPQVKSLLQDGRISFGAQNSSRSSSGAYTGEVTAGMLAEQGCKWVIVGHSERRTLFSETDECVAQKVLHILESKMSPIVCVGETLDQRENGKAESVCCAQLTAVIEQNKNTDLSSIVIAYEPVWAIGTGRTATPEQAQNIHRSMRSMLVDLGVSERVRIIYGGSVKAENASELFAQPDIDGALVGGASLQSEEFVAVCKAAF